MTVARPPIAMLAELTHRCPLSCPYCSNPVDMALKDSELSTDAWKDVFVQAADIGVLQLHLSGGEPATRRDLEELVAAVKKVFICTIISLLFVRVKPDQFEELQEDFRYEPARVLP